MCVLHNWLTFVDFKSVYGVSVGSIQKGCVVGFDCVLDEIAEPDFSACVETIISESGDSP